MPDKCFCGGTEFERTTHHYWEVLPDGTYKNAMRSMPIGQCARCGMIRQLSPPFETQEEYQRYYSEYPPTSREYTVKDLAHDREVAGIRCEDCGVYSGSEKTLLDIGSGSGAFVALCRERGVKAFGCELAEYHGAAAKEFTYRQPFEEIGFPTDHFDLVTCYDVLEHVLDPLAFVKEAARVLKQGGEVVIDFPACFLPEGDHHWKREHVWYFRPEDVVRLLESVGLCSAKPTQPIPSKFSISAIKPGQSRPTILVPPGIGDSFWSIVKLPAFLREKKLKLPEVAIVCPRSKSFNGHQRAFPFLEMFPFIKASWDTVEGRDPKSREIWKEAYQEPGRTVFENVLGFDYFLSYNGHLRIGEELEDADALECDWHPRMWRAIEQDHFLDMSQRKYGPYIVFYFVFQGTYCYWTGDFPVAEVIRSVQAICRSTGCRPVFAGGAWDAQDSSLATVLRAVPEAINLIGKTSVQQLFGLLRGSELVVGYPSGLTIMSATMGVPTLCIWNDYYNRDFFWNAVPPDVRRDTYHIDTTDGLTAQYLSKRAASIIAGDPLPQKPMGPFRTLQPPPPPPIHYDPDSLSLTCACVYKTGGDYTPDYVRKLVAAVRRNTTVNLDFVCLTDDSKLQGDFRTIPLVDNLEGWWSKIELFRPGVTDRKHILYFDLDTVIVDDISNLVWCSVGFGALQPWNRINREDGLLASGVMYWEQKLYQFIYHEFRPEMMTKYPKGDQAYISSRMGGRGYPWVQLQNKIQISSYRRHCQGRRHAPGKAKIVCFHGYPRPHECVEPWVKEHWR